MSRLEVGKIINTHGLKGEVKIMPWTDNAEDFESIKRVYSEKTGEALTISGVKYQKNNLIVKFCEIVSIEEAEAYKNTILTAERSDLPPLPDGRYYVVDLIGCTVKDESGQELGRLTDIFTAGGGDVYEITPETGKQLYISAAGDTVKSTDIKNKTIVVSMPQEWEE